MRRLIRVMEKIDPTNRAYDSTSPSFHAILHERRRPHLSQSCRQLAAEVGNTPRSGIARKRSRSFQSTSQTVDSQLCGSSFYRSDYHFLWFCQSYPLDVRVSRPNVNYPSLDVPTSSSDSARTRQKSGGASQNRPPLASQGLQRKTLYLGKRKGRPFGDRQVRNFVPKSPRRSLLHVEARLQSSGFRW